MLRMMLTAGIGILTLVQTQGQLKKFYSLRDDSTFDTVRLSLEASFGSCYIRTSKNSDPLNIYGNPDLERVNPSYKTNISNNSCQVDLELQEYKSSGISDGFSFTTMFASNKSTPSKDLWKIYFTDDKVYDLNLNYGIGEANLDLSGSSVNKIKINTGSANVKVGYQDGMMNKSEMDTFYVKVDMGSFEAEGMNLMNATHVIAEIGFGNARLDFSESQKKKCNVTTSVSAGNIDIFLPEENTPVIIYVRDSPLCGIKLAKGFEEVENNVFVNMKYSADAKNLLTFNVDVALGSVTFH